MGIAACDGKFELEIKKDEPTRVQPVEETEKGTYFLCNTDQAMACIMRTIHLYKSPEKGNADAAKVVRESLSKALVHFYPLAGRLTISPEGKLIVDCTGEGPIFVEAEANCSVLELVGIASADPIVLKNLVYEVPGATNIIETPIFTVQVTNFKCGAFAVGMAINHCMVDGISAMEFIKSWGEIARGLPLSVPPSLDRTILKTRDPPKNEFLLLQKAFVEIEDISNTHELYEEEEMMYRVFPFNIEKLQRLKEKALEGGVLTKCCTTFEALTALVWRARCKSLRMHHDQQTKLLFAVDVRAKLNPQLPKGYFGNGIVWAIALCKAGDLLESPFSHTVELVQGAVKLVTDSYVRSSIDYVDMTSVRPSLNGTILITDWSRLAFHSSNFGWGAPIYTGPVGFAGKEVVLFLPSVEDRRSINVNLRMPASTMKVFEEEIMQI
ncbi:omega-hydroxypalmitate O-feruloyl transferase-like [Spinacia oleracea]|uniref:Omega-hydroxypalmitate O-feruloyl transferase-like n=1 Tax=Spinacia oleracea TaxID=3562 RepID=A0A9R0IBV6_SPIOL|nr:omega-hydroxypalmitate O-feruloyl transferase-like [Spinacia oleracea]